MICQLIRVSLLVLVLIYFLWLTDTCNCTNCFLHIWQALFCAYSFSTNRRSPWKRSSRQVDECPPGINRLPTIKNHDICQKRRKRITEKRVGASLHLWFPIHVSERHSAWKPFKSTDSKSFLVTSFTLSFFPSKICNKLRKIIIKYFPKRNQH